MRAGKYACSGENAMVGVKESYSCQQPDFDIFDEEPVPKVRIKHSKAVEGSRFMVQGSGFWVQGSGFRVQGAGCWVWGMGLGIWGLRYEVWG